MLQRFGNYEVLKRLAVGGMGEIFLARQVGLHGFERLVIIKTLLNEDRENDDHIAMFLAEARIAAMLNHPNIVQILDVGEAGGTYYIAMEYVPGENLSRIIVAALRQRRHDMWPFVVALKDAARALHHAHNQMDSHGQPINLVHRDVSPQNIMVRNDGVTKVVDFGIAKVAGAEQRTRTGVIKGKVGYMAPEQIRTGPVDARTDLFSLGVVLWEATVGRRMFVSMTDMDVLMMVGASDDTLPAPASVKPDYPRDLEALVVRAISRDPELRFQTGNDFADALEEILKHVPDADKQPLGPYVESLVGEQVRERTADLRSNTGTIGSPVPRTAPREASHPGVTTDAATLVESATLAEGRTPSSPRQTVVETLVGAAPIAAVAAPPSRAGGSTSLAARPRKQKVPAGVLISGALVALSAGVATYSFLEVRSRHDAPPVPPAVSHHAAAATPAAALTPAVEPAPAPAVAHDEPEPSAAPDKRPVSRPERKPAPVKEKPAPTTKEKPAAPEHPAMQMADGLLTLASKPWAEVTLDGQHIGTTPLFQVKVPAGKHVLKLANPKGLSKTVPIDVEPGKPLKLKVDLE